MDLKLPYVMGLDVLRWIRTQPRTSLIVLMLTASAAEPDISEAYRLGANAFLTKPAEASKLEDMVKAIKAFWLTHNTMPAESLPESAGQRTFSLMLSRETSLIAKSLFQADALANRTLNGNGHRDPLLAQSPLHQRPPHAAQPQRAAPALTRRQTEVMQLIAEGFSSREIARQFSVSTKTVEKHRQALMDRLNIHEIATLTRYAVSCGLVECTPGSRALERSGDHEITVGLDSDSGQIS
jgi:DNA-binding NarL/FixJ family response regulator